MKWKPISETEIWDKLNEAYDRMNGQQRKLWHNIRIAPEKWQQHPYGDEGGGFWTVGLLGKMVVWFNDIEDGFNRSPYSKYGTIDAYYCNQDQLEWTVQHLLNAIEHGYDAVSFAGAPQPLK